MWRKHSSPDPLPERQASRRVSREAELDGLMTAAVRWGMEAGFLGIDGRFEERMAPLLAEASERVFDECEAGRERLAPELEALEARLRQALGVREEFRERYGNSGLPATAGPLRRLRSFVWDWLDYHAACNFLRRAQPGLRELRTRFDRADAQRRAAGEWRKSAMVTLRANHEYQKARAALARQSEERIHDTRDALRIVGRAN
jgi:hypothetical protein